MGSLVSCTYFDKKHMILRNTLSCFSSGKQYPSPNIYHKKDDTWWIMFYVFRPIVNSRCKWVDNFVCVMVSGLRTGIHLCSVWANTPVFFPRWKLCGRPINCLDVSNPSLRALVSSFVSSVAGWILVSLFIIYGNISISNIPVLLSILTKAFKFSRIYENSISPKNV